MKNLFKINRALVAEKKISSLLLALIACAGTIFADGTKIGDLYYNLNANDLTAEVTRMPSGAYTGDVIIPESVEYNSETYSVTSIGFNAFNGYSNLTSISIPNSVTSIGEWAFAYCSGLTSIIIPNSVTSIEDAAFRDCTGLTSIIIPNSVTSIGDAAFRDCTGLTSITISNSVTRIGGHAFFKCSGLTSITIPNSVTNIGDAAFKGCSGLTSVTIPSSVTSIEEEAFANCTGLTSVTNYATTPQTIKDMAVFSGVNQSSCTLYVPEGSIDLYKAADGWKDFGNIQAIAETQSIGEVTNHQSPITNKIIKDNQIYILTGDKTYTVDGRLVR